MTDLPDTGGILGSVFFLVVGAGVLALGLQMSPMAAMFPRTVRAVLALLVILDLGLSLRGS